MATRLINYNPVTKAIISWVNNKRWDTNVATKTMPTGTTLLSAAEKTELTNELTYFEKAVNQNVKYLDVSVQGRPVL